MTYLTLSLVIVALIKRTLLSGMVALGALISAILINNDLVITDTLNKIIVLAVINAVLTFGCILVWANTKTHTASILSKLGVLFLCLSFAQLFVYANVLDSDSHNSIQQTITSFFDYLTMIVIAMLLVEPVEPGRKHVRSIWDSINRYFHHSVYSGNRGGGT